jgi:hypothetical protein
MRYRLRTLLIVLALGPPLLGWGWSLWRELSNDAIRLESLRRLREAENRAPLPRR